MKKGEKGNPDWLEKMEREGRVRETVVNPAALPRQKVNVTITDIIIPEDTCEQVFQDLVIGVAKGRGWYIAHIRKVRVMRKDLSFYYETPIAVDGKGFPDLELVRDERIIKAELKTNKNQPTPEQIAWGERYKKLPNLEYYVWRPRDWKLITSILE